MGVLECMAESTLTRETEDGACSVGRGGSELLRVQRTASDGRLLRCVVLPGEGIEES